MAEQPTVRVVQTRAYLRPAGYRLLDEVMKDQRELYNAALEHRRTAYAYHKVRCFICVENARLDQRLKLHRLDCHKCIGAEECERLGELQTAARTRREKCNDNTHAESCPTCGAPHMARAALRTHARDCEPCRTRTCGHKRRVDGCDGCYCGDAAELRAQSRADVDCHVGNARRVTRTVQSRAFTSLKEEYPRFASVDRRVSMGTLQRLELAFDGFYGRVQQGQAPGYPRFKGRERFRTLQIYSGANRYMKTYDPEIGKGVIRVKGLPSLRFKCARIPGGQQPRDIKITLKPNGKVWLSMSFEFDADAVSVKKDGDPKPRRGLPTTPLGVDMGVNKARCALLRRAGSAPSRQHGASAQGAESHSQDAATAGLRAGRGTRPPRTAPS